jgi:very-short-patch-repair endonuclease
MRETLAKNGIEASHEYCLMESRRCKYRLDFAIFCQRGRIDVECDNERWHLQPARRIKDQGRNKWLNQHGWVVLRFPGKQIKDNPERCIASLKQVIQELGGC